MTPSQARRWESTDRGIVTYPMPDGVTVERDLTVEMRDGTRLSVTVSRPDRAGRFPVILCLTAYRKDFALDDDAYNWTLRKIREGGMAIGTLHLTDLAP